MQHFYQVLWIFPTDFDERTFIIFMAMKKKKTEQLDSLQEAYLLASEISTVHHMGPGFVFPSF